MTTIIAIENSDHALIASDSQATMGHTKMQFAGKVFSNGPYTIGIAGMAMYAEFLANADLPEPDGMPLARFMSQVWRPTVHEAAHKFNEKVVEGSVALVAIQSQVFLITPYEVLQNSRGHYAVGSGSNFALGALSQVNGDVSKSDVLSALKAAAAYDIYTSGPFYVRKV